MCKCFCCGKEVQDEDAVPVPFLKVVICRECEQTTFVCQKKFPRPDYGKAWARPLEIVNKRRE